MYSYFYDAFLQDRRYERELAGFETRLTDLGIMGKITRLALFRDGVEVIKDEIEEGSETLVAVGDDSTLRLAIEAVGDSRSVIGYLPVSGKKSFLATLLGIPSGVEACDILSARLVQDIDVGEVNGRRFLHALEGEAHGATITCEQSYKLQVAGKAYLAWRNLAPPDEIITNPTDKRLDLVIRQPHFSLFGRKSDISHLLIKRSRVVTDKHLTLTLDGGEKIQAQDFDIRAIPGRLRLITGKDRTF